MQARQGNVVPAYGVIHIVYLRRERFSVVSVRSNEQEHNNLTSSQMATMAVIRAYSMCASGVEKCAQTLLRTVLCAPIWLRPRWAGARALERPVLDLVKH